MSDTTVSATSYSDLALNYLTGLANVSLANKQAAVGAQPATPATNLNTLTKGVAGISWGKIGIGVAVLIGVGIGLKKLLKG